MQKALLLAQKIRSDLGKNWLTEIEDVNLHKCFEPIYRLEYSIITLNTLTCSIIYSYDNESKWIDLKQDGFTINKNILVGLDADPEEPIFKEFVESRNEEILYAIGNYLDLIPDWKYVTARKQIDFHGKYVRSTEPNAMDLEEDKKIKARENIGRLIKESVSQRKAADELLELIHKENVNTQRRVEQEFGVDFTQKSLEFSDSTQQRDIMSWRSFIQFDVIPKRKQQKQ